MAPWVGSVKDSLRRKAALLGASCATALLIGPLASPARAAFSAPTKLSAPDVEGTKATIDAEGNAIAVWSHYDGAKWPIQERQISAAGDLGPVKTIPTGSEKPLWPQIAGDPAGGAIVVWSQLNSSESKHRIKAQSISANGRLSAVRIISPKRRSARSPRIASDARGDAIVVWSQARHGTWRIKARRIRAEGQLGHVKTLSGARHNSQDPQIASDARGDAVAVWSQSGKKWRIKARRIRAKGTLGDVKALSRPGHGAGFAQVAVDRRDKAIVVWGQFNSKDSNRRIKARRISSADALGPVMALSLEGHSAGVPEVASNARGDAAVVWTTYNDRVQARRISAAGRLGSVQTLSSSGRPGFGPQVALDRAGNATTVWYEVEYGPLPYLQTRQISATGSLGPTQTLAAADTRDPQIAVNAEGDAFAAWSQFDGSNWRAWGALGP